MALAHDVVCGMEVSTETSSHAEHEAKDYYFCCDGCKGAFVKAPAYHLENWAEEHPGVEPTLVAG